MIPANGLTDVATARSKSDAVLRTYTIARWCGLAAMTRGITLCRLGGMALGS